MCRWNENEEIRTFAILRTFAVPFRPFSQHYASQSVNDGNKSQEDQFCFSKGHLFLWAGWRTVETRADKGWVVWIGRVRAKRCDAMDWDYAYKCRLFSTSVRACDVICPLDTAAVILLNYVGLICFLALRPRFFVLARCLWESNVAIFCGRFNWSRQTSFSKGFSHFHDSTTELYFRSTIRQCRPYSKTKTTKYCLKHEGKSHPCHPWQN